MGVRAGAPQRRAGCDFLLNLRELMFCSVLLTATGSWWKLNRHCYPWWFRKPETCPMARVWVRDLTEEGIEPHPGPLPTSGRHYIV